MPAPLSIARPDDPAAALVASADPYAAWEAAGAPVPAMKSPRIRLATRGPLGADTGETALAALEALDPPKPAFGRPLTGVQAVTAYVATEADPGAQLALKMIIERDRQARLRDNVDLAVPQRRPAAGSPPCRT